MSEEVSTPGALHFSLAGVQLKFSADRQARSGLSIPVDGVGGSNIIKLPSAEFEHLPENEFSMMTLAARVGIEVPAFDLVSLDQISGLPRGTGHLGRQAFVIERFDRAPGGQRIHVEDFAQVFDVYPHDKYGKASYRNILTVLFREAGMADVDEFIRRLVFMVLTGNGDMHLKNWSLIYRDRIRPRLSPAYDLLTTLRCLPADRPALRFSRYRTYQAFTSEELRHMASRAGVPAQRVIDTALETVERFMQVWQAEQTQLPLHREAVQAINAHLRTLPLIDS